MGNNSPLQNLKGFRDFIGVEKDARDFLMGELKTVFKKYGFEPLETPTLEYAELLMGKYGDEADKLIYNFEDKGGRQVALRYDQTVPSARILAQYQSKLPKFYRRYQMQTVFRAEKPQKGRYREFMQCDIDIFGSNSWLADAEVLACAYEAYVKIGFDDIQIRINDRNLLFNALQPFATEQVDVLSIIQSIDKLDKLAEEDVAKELVEKGLAEAKANEALVAINQVEPTQELQELLEQAKALGVKAESLVFTPTLARGLNYYTGPIYEFVTPRIQSGSLGGGGRYDKLIEQLSGTVMPATGFAFGFDRIIAVMEELGILPRFNVEATAVVAVFNADTLSYSLEIAAQLRRSGIKTIVYPQTGDKLDKQFKYADQIQARFVLIAGPEEMQQQKVQVKDLTSGEQKQTAANDVAAALGD